jgi:hypothetical protein
LWAEKIGGDTVASLWERLKTSVRADERRLVGREDNDPPAPQYMLPKYWGDTLSSRELNLEDHRRIATSGARGVREEDAWDSDCEIHEQPNTFIFPSVAQYDFLAVVEHAPAGVWPAEADDLFERLADEYRGYAPTVWPFAVRDVMPNLVETVREILEADSTGGYFMHYGADRATRYWTHPPSLPTAGTLLPAIKTDEGRLAAHWSAGFVFTRMRRHIRWERFPLRDCTLCGTRMRHSRDQSFVRDYRYGLEAPPRWCQSCTGRTIGQVSVKEIEFALQAYVAATARQERPCRLLGVATRRRRRRPWGFAAVHRAHRAPRPRRRELRPRAPRENGADSARTH